MIFTAGLGGQRQGVENGDWPDLKLNINSLLLPLGGSHIYIKNHIHPLSLPTGNQSSLYTLKQATRSTNKFSGKKCSHYEPDILPYPKSYTFDTAGVKLKCP